MPTASLLLLPLKPFLRLLPSLLGLLPPPAPPVHGEPVLSLSKRDPVHARSPGPPSLRIRRHPLEPRTHPPGRTRQTQLSTRPESAPKIRQSSRPGTTHLPFPRPPRARPRPAEGACPELAEGESTPRTSPPNPAKMHPAASAAAVSEPPVAVAAQPARPAEPSLGP